MGSTRGADGEAERRTWSTRINGLRVLMARKPETVEEREKLVPSRCGRSDRPAADQREITEKLGSYGRH